jgi:hypothetical protein
MAELRSPRIGGLSVGLLAAFETRRSAELSRGGQ